MAALNITETEALRTARGQMDGVARVLLDPNRNITAEDRRVMADLLKQASAKVNMVVTVKGHYPK